ncbi:hypothetical protein K3495_g4212 [Podosphaera aphanis]|nr:hypothetical protein K3495_g4212 [Podosphaera aphanis]
MSLIRKHSNRRKPATDDRHTFVSALEPNFNHLEECHSVSLPRSDSNHDYRLSNDQYYPDQSSSRPVVNRSQSTRNPGLIPDQPFTPQQFPVDDPRGHHRYTSQSSPADAKKGKRFFQRMLTNTTRNSEGKTYPPSVHRNIPSLTRRVSANDASPVYSSINSISNSEDLGLRREPLQYSNISFSSAQEEFEVNAASGAYNQSGQVDPSICQNRPSIQADQDDSKSPSYKLFLDEQRHQLQDPLSYQKFETHHQSEQGYRSPNNANISQSSLLARDSYRCQSSETASQLSLESQEDQRAAPVNDYFSSHPNQQLYSILQNQVSRPDSQYMAPPTISTTSRRSADQKPSLQVQQEARDGQSSNFNRSQFSNNPPSTPGLSPLPPGTQGPTYRSSTQRDQYSSHNDQGRKTPPPPPAERDLNDTYKELVTKYKKVKGLYFEKTAQVEQLQNTLANQRLSQSRTSLDDSEYMTRFQRLEGAVTNLAFNIRKDWRTVPFWLSQHVNYDALKIGKQEMTAVGRAVITKFLVDEIFNLTFHPGLPSELSSSLKVIEQNIRRFSPALNNQEESHALNAKVAQWRLTTLEGLKDILSLPESEENKKKFASLATNKLTGYIIKFLQEPIPPGVEDSAHMIVELAVGIASNLPLESREISIVYPMPGDTLQPAIMKLENPIPALVDPGAETDDGPSTQAGEEDESGKDKQEHGTVSGNSGGKKETGSEIKKTEDGNQKIRFSGFIQVKTLANEGYSRRKISQRLGLSYRQVSYTVDNPDTPPKKSLGRPPVLSTSQVDEKEAFAYPPP